MDPELMSEEDREYEQKKQDKILVKHCMRLVAAAEEKKPTAQLEQFDEFYLSREKAEAASNGRAGKSFYPIINPIVETKVSLAMDSDVTTTVNAVIGSAADIEKIDTIEAVSDYMNDVLNSINEANKIEGIGRTCVRNMLKTGIMIGEVGWDQQKKQGLGEVTIKALDPKRVGFDPNGTSVENCNYAYVRMTESTFSLKKMYPNKIKEIDQLAQTANSKKGDSKNDYTKGEIKGQVTYRTDDSATPVYITDTAGIQNATVSIDVYKMYLRDDSTFIPAHDDTSEETQKSIEIGLRYPFGRVIIFAGEDVIFEDKPLEVAVGIPIVTRNIYETDTIWGQGDVEKLIPIQKRYNNAYMRLSFLIYSFISTLLVDPITGIVNEGQMINQLITIIETGMMPNMPQHLTNNTLSEIKTLSEVILALKQEAKEVARVNDIMISGNTMDNVTSGKMVDSLIESPMTSIREIQNVYYSFLEEIAGMCLQFAQVFYTVPRIIRITGGKKFISLTPPMGDGQNESLLQVIQKDEETKQLYLIDEIKSDLSLVEFECEINTGRKLPRTRGGVAQMTLSMWEKGVFGDPMSITSRKILLKNTDYPNYHGIVKELEAEETERNATPPPVPMIDKINVSFSELPEDSKAKVLLSNGLVMEPTPPVPGVM